MLKRVAQFSAWQALGQALSAATILVLGVLLPATPLATFGYALSISSLLSTFITLRLEQAILVAESDQDASRLAWAAIGIASFVSFLTALAAILITRQGSALPFIAGALSALSISAVAISQQVLIRHGRSNDAGRMAALRAVLLMALTVGFTLAGNRNNARGALFGISVGAILVTLTCLWELRRTAKLQRSEITYRKAIASYKDVWSAYLGQSILSGISLNAPYVALFHSVDHVLVAGYLLADRLARTPVALLSTSVRSHLTHDYMALLRQKDFAAGKAVTVRWSSALALSASVGLSAIGLIVHSVGAYYASQKWSSAGAAVGVLALWATSVLSNPPSAATLTAWRKNSYILRAQAVELAARLIIIGVLIPFASSHFYVTLFCIHLPGVIYNLALFLKASRVWETARA